MRIILSIIVLISLGLYSVPYLIRDQVVIWLKDQGVENASFEKVDIHWLSGAVELLQLKAESDGMPPINVGHLKVSVDYVSLVDKRIFINEVLISDVASGLHQKGDDLWLGPINLSQFESGEKAKEPEGPPTEWKFGIANVDLSQVSWSLDIPQHQQQLVIDNAELSALYQWDEGASTHLSIDALLNGSRIKVNTDAVPLPDKKTSTIKLVLDQFPLQSVAKAWVPQLRGVLTTNLELSLDITDGTGQLSHSGSFSLDDFAWQDEQLTITDKHLAWKGKGSVELAEGDLQNIALDGALQNAAINIEQGSELGLLMSQFNWKGGVNLLFVDKLLSSIQGPQNLTVKDLKLRQSDLNVSAATLTQNGPLNIQFEKGSPKRVKTNVGLNVAALDLKNSDIDVAAAQLSLASPLDINWQGSDISGISAVPVIALQQLKLIQGGRLAVDLASADLSAAIKNMQVTQPVIDKIQLTGSALNVATIKDPLQLLQLKSLNLNNAFYSANKISSDQVTLSGLKASYKQGQNPLSTIGEVRLKGILLSDLTRLAINDIRLKDSKTTISVTKKQAIKEIEALTKALATLEDKNAAPAKKSPESKSTAFTSRIGKLQLTGSNLIYIEDHSVKPTFKSTVDIKQLSVAKVDTGKGGLSPFSLKAAINKHAILTASGKMNLLGGAKNGDWKIDLKNAELPVVSPYAGKYVGYFLQSGQMDFSSSGTLKKGVLSGKNRIKLNRLEVQPAQNEATGNFNKTLSMPLGTAISVLQDSEDNIKLDVPVEGSLDDPQFGYQSIINRLASKGLKKAAFGFLTKALQPYGALISLASTAIDAKKSGAFITLAPVNFAAGTINSDADAGDYLGKISEMMVSRKGLRLNICGNAVKADRANVLVLLEKENKAKPKPLPPAGLEVLVMERLQELAAERGELVTSMLLEKGIPKDRLFSCFPVPNLKDDKLKPGVLLGL
jgi:hypothetical protein